MGGVDYLVKEHDWQLMSEKLLPQETLHDSHEPSPAPTRVALSTSAVPLLMVPPVTWAPGPLFTLRLSPETLGAHNQFIMYTCQGDSGVTRCRHTFSHLSIQSPETLGAQSAFILTLKPGADIESVVNLTVRPETHAMDSLARGPWYSLSLAM